jgi:hypothetical protein
MIMLLMQRTGADDLAVPRVTAQLLANFGREPARLGADAVCGFGCLPRVESERASSSRSESTARRSATCGGKIKVRGRLRGKWRSCGPV